MGNVPAESCECADWVVQLGQGPGRELRGTSQSAPDRHGSSPLSGGSHMYTQKHIANVL